MVFNCNDYIFVSEMSACLIMSSYFYSLFSLVSVLFLVFETPSLWYFFQWFLVIFHGELIRSDLVPRHADRADEASPFGRAGCARAGSREPHAIRKLVAARIGVSGMVSPFGPRQPFCVRGPRWPVVRRLHLAHACPSQS